MYLRTNPFIKYCDISSGFNNWRCQTKNIRIKYHLSDIHDDIKVPPTSRIVAP